jgi:hypothetical protein
MTITETEFNSLSKENQFDLLNIYGQFIGNRIYYNHRINLYSLNGFFVEVHYLPIENEIDKIEAVNFDYVQKGYYNKIKLNFE